MRCNRRRPDSACPSSAESMESPPATFYRWRQKYGALTKSELARLTDLERENGRLKKLVAELTLDKQILQDVLAKKD
jgi:transposase